MRSTCRALLIRLGHGCREGGRWLACRTRAAARRCFPAAARVLVVAPLAERAERARLVAAVRRGLLASELIHDGLPPLPCRVRVLPLLGAPPAFAPLGHALATVAVRPIAGCPRAVISLAATRHGRAVADGELIAALTAALDHLAAREPGDAGTWLLPAPDPALGHPSDAPGRRPPVGAPSWPGRAAPLPPGIVPIDWRPARPAAPDPAADPLDLAGR